MELVAAKHYCEALHIPHQVISLGFISDIFRSSLLQDGDAIPEGHFQDESMRSTVVPFRNGIMLSIAAGIAESMDCYDLLIANHAGDHAIYPDCRPSFIASMATAISMGTFTAIKLIAPYTNINKRDIAVLGNTLGVDMGKTYSCYKGGAVHCGRCGACVERKEALEGFDTTEYMT